MIIAEDAWENWPALPAASVVIGVLDGVHRGHRSLIERANDGGELTVLTFDPHPIEVLRPGADPRLITTIDERCDLLASLGVDNVGVLDLGQIRDQEPERFVEDILVGKASVRRLVVGSDFRFGRDRSGDVGLLRELGERHGYVVEIAPMVHMGSGADGRPISSSHIRALIESGDVSEASNLLASRFRVTNEVVHGDKRGREIGFPTANLRPPDRKVIPANGVYACVAVLDGHRHEAAVNVGVRPTFGGGERLVEAYLLDFDEEIYGRPLTIEFVGRLRPELAFDDVDELVSQMHRDVAEARKILDEVAGRI